MVLLNSAGGHSTHKRAPKLELCTKWLHSFRGGVRFTVLNKLQQEGKQCLLGFCVHGAYEA